MTTPEEMGRILDAMPAGQRAYVILAGNLDVINRRAEEIKDLSGEMRAQCDAWVVWMNRENDVKFERRADPNPSSGS